MKAHIIILLSTMALTSAGVLGSDEDAIAGLTTGVIMRNGVVFPHHATVGKYYNGSLWADYRLGTSSEDMAAALSSRQSTTEENMASLLGDYTPEELAEAWGYGFGDIEAFLLANGFSTMEDAGIAYGYASYEEWVNAWWGYDPGQETVASWMGYNVPGQGNVAGLLADYGYGSLEEMANAYYSTTVYPSLDREGVLELAHRLTELTPEMLTNALAIPSVQTPENLLSLQASLQGNLVVGNLDTWDPFDVQDVMFDILSKSATSSNNPTGSLLAQMDFSNIDLTNRSLSNMVLTGSNITGEQINQAVGITNANLSGLNLSGLSLAGKSAQGVNFAGATGITAAEILVSPNVQSANLSGLDFTGANLSGKVLTNTRISGASNLTGAQFNGVANVRGAVLEGLDLSGWTTPLYTGDWNTAVASLANSIVNTNIMNSQLSRNANLNGVDLGFWRPNGIFGVNLAGVKNFTGANITNHIYWGTDMGTTDMTGYNFTGRTIAGDFRNVKNMTGADLNRAGSLIHAGIFSTNLSGRDLTGWQPTYDIRNANLSNTTGITAQSIATATNITGINLRGTGISKAQLDAALTAAGKNPATGNFNTSTISF